MSIGGLLIIAAVAFLSAAFFAGSETAYLACDRTRLRHLARTGDKRARLMLRYIKDPEYFFSIVLVGTNLGMTGCTATFTAVMIHFFGDSGATVATLILVPTLLVFQEILPKGIFLYYADAAAVLSLYPLRFFAGILYPIIHAFSGVTKLLSRIFRIGKVDRKLSMTMEELLFHLQSSREAGMISSDTLGMVNRAFALLDFSAEEVMVPLDRVTMAKEGLTIEAYLDMFRRERFSRVPLYRTSRQDIKAFLSMHNLFKAYHSKSGTIEFEEPYVVPVNTPIVEILIRMKNQGCHMAMIRDRKGLIIGMTTLEDILERLVGAIADEFH